MLFVGRLCLLFKCHFCFFHSAVSGGTGKTWLRAYCQTNWLLFEPNCCWYACNERQPRNVLGAIYSNVGAERVCVWPFSLKVGLGIRMPSILVEGKVVTPKKWLCAV